jgi:hypothetical protein
MRLRRRVRSGAGTGMKASLLAPSQVRVVSLFGGSADACAVLHSCGKIVTDPACDRPLGLWRRHDDAQTVVQELPPMTAARFAGVLILGGCVFSAGLAFAQTAPDAAPNAAIVPVSPPVAAVPEAPPPQSSSQRGQDRTQEGGKDSASSLPADGATADNTAAAGDARYTFLRSDDGFMRLDNRNGEVAFCSKRAVGWACQMLPEDRAALESEIARLQRQNATLKKELMTRGIALPNTAEPLTPPVAQNRDKDDRNPKIPSDADVARMKSMVGDMWQRLVEMIARLQADALKKS